MHIINPYRFATGEGVPSDYRAYWKFDNNLNDESSNGYTLTGVNSPTYINDRKGNPNSAISFVATSSQYVYINSDLGLNWSNQLTACGWLYGMGQNGLLFSNQSLTYPLLRQRAGSGALRLNQISDNNINVDSANGAAISLSQWRFYLFEKDGNEERLYIDNALYLSHTLTDPITNINRFVLGALFFGASVGQYETGFVDSVRIYDRLLTTDEKTALYNE